MYLLYNFVYIEIILKILAIAYLASFCSEICKDAGAGTLHERTQQRHYRNDYGRIQRRKDNAETEA